MSTNPPLIPGIWSLASVLPMLRLRLQREATEIFCPTATIQEDKRGAAKDITGTARDKKGTTRDKTGTTRDKTGTARDKTGTGA